MTASILKQDSNMWKVNEIENAYFMWQYAAHTFLG